MRLVDKTDKENSQVTPLVVQYKREGRYLDIERIEQSLSLAEQLFQEGKIESALEVLAKTSAFRRALEVEYEEDEQKGQKAPGRSLFVDRTNGGSAAELKRPQIGQTVSQVVSEDTHELSRTEEEQLIKKHLDAVKENEKRGNYGEALQEAARAFKVTKTGKWRKENSYKRRPL